MRKRIKYSQNFLRDVGLIKQLLDKSNIFSDDTVLEIGAGEGIITGQLLKRAKKVIAFELDKSLFDKLSEKFQNENDLELRFESFLDYNLPNQPYKVFSNIPFNITSAIIKKLTSADNPPEEAYLVVQKEAAEKFAGKPLSKINSLLSVLLYPWFDFQVKHKFEKGDFVPRPSIESLFLGIKKRSQPLVGSDFKDDYRDFVAFTFSQFKPSISEGLSKVIGKEKIAGLTKKHGFLPTAKPSELNFTDWLVLFDAFLDMPASQKNIVKGSYLKILRQQENIEKIHRTRVDKNWRNVKND